MSTRRLRFLLISLIVLIVLAGAASADQVTLVANCTGCTYPGTNTLVTANPDSVAYNNLATSDNRVGAIK
ncbi:MAG: hypothetical protein WC568_01720 [Candidatus Methanoperedens sp.]